MLRYVSKMGLHYGSTSYRAKLTLHKDKYQLLPIPTRPWADLSMNSVDALPRTQREKDSVMVLMDGFPKMEHFISCNKNDDTNSVVTISLMGLLNFMEFHLQ